MTNTSGLQPMPVADAICQPGRVIWWNGQAEPSRYFVPSLAGFKRVNFVRAPHPAEMTKGLADGYDDWLIRVREAVGPQTMPFPDMWFEGVIPWNGYMRSGGTPAVATAVRAHQYDGAIEPSTGERFYANAYTVFMLLADGSIMRMPFQATELLTETGVIKDLEATHFDPNTGRFDRQIPDGGPWEWAFSVAMAAMWAIGLMNCKNVKTPEVQRVPMKTKKQRRARGTGLLSYRTIVLPGAASDNGGNGQGAGRTRLHTVRGHFATYGPEAPLFGKLVGTYWRPWHLSGNPERGVVESDYRLEGAQQ